ncbi:hypothetical protein JIN84_13785 [Luteolibacter yonseiensis]|uniref:Uncharacterized protein n=1 Tax=Luteolibacter yonseiensis TaxID=1144680 RepID=A0A934R5D9_9BACT|nr:hypothetical protein [Luteolibacter yonseiensis]MBK1816692.1 hypothetical protein [Luteolibacter yonseiensis]
MKSRQFRITAATAVVSFALGVAFAPTFRDHQPPATGSPDTNSSLRSHPGNTRGENEDPAGRTRVALREEKKKATEPTVSIPLATVTKMISQHQVAAGMEYLIYGVERSLPLLGVSEVEKKNVIDALKRIDAEIQDEEKKQLKAIQTDPSEIRLDSSGMEAFSKTLPARIQESLRSHLATEQAEVLISSLKWNLLYSTEEKWFPTLTITRTSSGRLIAWARTISGKTGPEVDAKYADDGTPIPADEVFPDRWKPFLKGFTLLPTNED